MYSNNKPPASEEDHIATSRLVAVAIDREKNSQFTVKWAVDHLFSNSPTLLLIHVNSKATPNQQTAHENSNVQPDEETNQLFLPYRGFCARKQVRYKEVILEDNDIPKAIIEYITKACVDNLVIGSSTRNAIARKFKTFDVPACLTKGVPDYCGLYMISKGKLQSVRPSQRAAPIHPSAAIASQNGVEEVVNSLFLRSGGIGGRAPNGAMDRRSFERGPAKAEKPLSTAKSVPPNLSNLQHFRDNNASNLDFSFCGGGPPPPRLSNSSGSDIFIGHDTFGSQGGFRSMDFAADGFDTFSVSTDSPRSSFSSTPTRDVEAEMKRLKQELKQTMDMYSTACREAISAKQKARELHQWKMEEARKFEEARMSEEAALAIAEMEKAKAKAAIEAAEAAQRIAEIEARKRMNAEMKAKREAEERKKAVDKLANNDFRYRRYPIEDIEVATDFFSESLKIGEGGYGPVYRACLDHTPVAIKVLRPDAAQGRKQFQQEIEVLSCIRHPNMVLLLGACPEYGCLVYEYMENGSLEDRLFRRGNTQSLPWRLRFKIAAEIATGLLFLHQTKPEPLVHRDLKPANILLDRNYVSKISDVGLARLVPPSVADTVTQYRMTSTAGTFCYIDPEYQQTGMLGIKSDIYSLGIMLLQIVTAKPPMGLTHHVERSIDRGTFAEMLDQTVPDWPVEEALFFAKLALKCAELRRKDRPDLGTVVLPELYRLSYLGVNSDSGGGGGSWGPGGYAYSHSRHQSIALQETMRSHPYAGGESRTSTEEGATGGTAFTGGRLMPKKMAFPDDE